jgi:hypothetical protein
VTAVDRVGNQRTTATRRFVIALGRLAPRSRAQVLHSGLVVLVFCPRRCQVHVTVRFDTGPVALSATRHFGRGGIERVVLAPLPAALRRAHGGRLNLTVTRGRGRGARSVALSQRW